MIFVFVSGASGSGKTSLSKQLSAKLSRHQISNQIISIDDYYFERPEQISPEEYLKTVNLDIPEMVDMKFLQKQLLELSQGKSVEKPIYSFITSRYVGKQILVPTQVCIIEGIFAQYFAQTHMPDEIESLTINVANESYSDTLRQRIKRDIDERNSKEEIVVKREREFVGPGFFRFTASSASPADIHVLNKYATMDQKQDELTRAAEEVYEELVKLIKRLKKDIVPRPRKPEVQELVARSHIEANYLAIESQFQGQFSGMFGIFKGMYKKKLEVIEEVEEPLIVSAKL